MTPSSSSIQAVTQLDEPVPGQTLSALLQQRGALPPHEAAALMRDVLEALVAAHAAGVVHLDLKPANILVDANGRARLMDSGRVASAAAPALDVFSAGLVLADMLSGQPLMAERDPRRAVERMQPPLELPADLGADVDPVLRACVMRALAHDPAQRYPDARGFLADLEQWLDAVSPDHACPEEGSGGTLDALLRRMRYKSDFPALSSSIVRIQRISSSDKESVASLTNEILKDVALTHKLLRLVNSAYYARDSSSISTVSRAVTLVGFNGIRNLAFSLVLLEHMQDKAHVNVLKEEFLRSLMAGTLARELCPQPQACEETFIGAMFQNLGRLVTEYYFPEKARAVRALTGAQEALSEAAAASSVLGLSYEALGLGISRAWNLPDSIQRCIRKPLGTPPASPPLDVRERIRWIALASNEMADVLLRSDPKEVAGQLARLGQRYGRSMGVSSRDVERATAKAREKLGELAHAIDIKVAPGSLAARLLRIPEAEAGAQKASDTDAGAAAAADELHATPSASRRSEQRPAPDSQRVSDMLIAGIQDITNAMVEEFRLSDVLRMILETMLRALAFRHIVFCMRDPKTEALTGRFGLGEGVETIVKSFHVSLKTSEPDLFSAVCSRGADTMISDATEPRIAERLPAWYRKSVNAPTFLLLPLQLKGASFGLIYADKLEPGGLPLSEKELALLRTLRNQAVMAFRQSS